ncbi:hypothetical protein [Nocardiopsis eucommiae]|uniref:hypothetical protein n=1 Tax=Nocardiopsis eucommiae TaxID=2831970 RepID=UPI003D739A4E
MRDQVGLGEDLQDVEQFLLSHGGEDPSRLGGQVRAGRLGNEGEDPRLLGRQLS